MRGQISADGLTEESAYNDPLSTNLHNHQGAAVGSAVSRGGVNAI
jgi:hypothetical protein